MLSTKSRGGYCGLGQAISTNVQMLPLQATK
jgi:hypothetical protein